MVCRGNFIERRRSVSLLLFEFAFKRIKHLIQSSEFENFLVLAVEFVALNCSCSGFTCLTLVVLKWVTFFLKLNMCFVVEARQIFQVWDSNHFCF